MRMARLDGGGLWMGEQSFYFHCPSQIRAARAIEAQLDGGVEEIVAWSHETPFSPGRSRTLEGVPHSDGSTFSDGTLYAGVGFSLTVAAAAPLRGTQLVVTGDAAALRGGERFSISHPTMGLRRYVIGRVDGNVLTIRTPLREALTGGERMDFDRVGCVVRLLNPDEFLGAVSLNSDVAAVAKWVESFNALVPS